MRVLQRCWYSRALRVINRPALEGRPARYGNNAANRARTIASSPCLAVRIRRLESRSSFRSVDAHAEDKSQTTPIPILITEFGRRVLDNTATVEQAGECLKGHRAEIEKLPFDERRKACRDLRAGARVLSWLLKVRDENTQPTHFYRDKTLTSALMWFAIAEGNEEIIWSWIALELKSDTPDSNRLVMHLLGGLASAHLAWGSDCVSEVHRDCPNAALQCFKRAVETSPQDKHSVILMAIGLEVSKALRRPECFPADEALFKYFVDRRLVWGFTNSLSHDRKTTDLHPQATFEQSAMLLFHPSWPETADLLHFLKHGISVQRLETHAMWLYSGPASVNQFAHMMLRLSYILRLQGNPADADWVDTKIAQRAPAIWRYRWKTWNQLERDPKLDKLRQSAQKSPGKPEP